MATKLDGIIAEAAEVARRCDGIADVPVRKVTSPARKVYREAVAPTSPARKAYREAVATAQKAFDKVTAPARKAYHEATAQAWKAYDEAFVLAQKEFDESVVPAQKAYDEAVALAQKEFDEAIAPARKAFDEAVATAAKAYDEATALAQKADDEATTPEKCSSEFRVYPMSNKANRRLSTFDVGEMEKGRIRPVNHESRAGKMAKIMADASDLVRRCEGISEGSVNRFERPMNDATRKVGRQCKAFDVVRKSVERGDTVVDTVNSLKAECGMTDEEAGNAIRDAIVKDAVRKTITSGQQT